MPDIFHNYGEDIQVSASGDVLVIDGTQLGVQRVMRRLFTNPGDYIFHPEYGAGLPQKIGTIQDVTALKALITSQLFQESVVAKSPAPVIVITPLGADLSSVAIQISYVDAVTGEQASLSFDLSE